MARGRPKSGVSRSTAAECDSSITIMTSPLAANHTDVEESPRPAKPTSTKRQSKACRRCSKRKQGCHGFPVCTNCEQAREPCEPSEYTLRLHRRDDGRAALDRIKSLESKLERALADLEEARRSQTDKVGVRSSSHRVPLATNPGTPPQTGADAVSQPNVGSGMSSRTASRRGSAHPAPSRLSAANEDVPPATDVTANLGHSPQTPRQSFTSSTSLDEIVQATVWSKALASTTSQNLPLPPSIKDIEKRSAGPPGDAAGIRMLSAYFDWLHPRYPFLDRAEMSQLHESRHNPPASSNVVGRFGTFKLYMVYAIGATILQRNGSHVDAPPPNTYFMAAMKHMSAAKRAQTVHNIEAMVLLILYNLRSSSNAGIWHMTGLAMRTCNDLRLHRESSYASPPVYKGELQRRLFWCVYLLERTVALSLERPLCISEQEIDTRLPCDVDDFVRDDQTIAMKLREQTPNGGFENPHFTPSNLTMWINFIQIKRFEAHIHSEVYCLNQPKSRLLAKVDPLLAALDSWYGRGLPPLSEPEKDYLTLHWNKANLLVLRPFLSLLRPGNPRIRRCLRASGEICEIFKRMHQRDSYSHSFVSAHSTFIAGITMCYCLFIDPRLFSMTVSNNLRACSSTMFVIAERAPETRKYRDILETMMSRATAVTVRQATSSKADGTPGNVQDEELPSRFDIPAMEGLLNLPADQDPSTVSTPDHGQVHGVSKAEGDSEPDFGPEFEFPPHAEVETSPSSVPFLLNQQGFPPGVGHTGLQEHSQGFIQTVECPDLVLTHTAPENDQFYVQMMLDVMSANGAC